MKNYILTIDIGGTNFRLGMVTEDKELYHYTIVRSESLYANGNSVQNLITSIKNYKQAHASGMKLLAIAIGFPSLISKNKKVVYSSPNLLGFNDINVADPLEDYFEVPVFIENDVNFLLQYEITKKQLVNKGITLGFYIGTGFGNAIYLNDFFLEGKNGAAGELGHIPVLSHTERCGCGNEGCIELYASGKRLTHIQEQYFPETPIQDVFTRHSDHPEIIRFIEALSIPIVTEINIFDPDQVLIGGGVIQTPNFPKKLLEEFIFKHIRKPFPANSLKLEYAQMSQTTGLLGAGYYAYHKLTKETIES